MYIWYIFDNKKARHRDTYKKLHKLFESIQWNTKLCHPLMAFCYRDAYKNLGKLLKK